MQLNQIKLLQFKNYQSQQLEFAAGLNCFTGLNGMGKTNLLDAIHYLCLGKGHNSSSDRDMMMHEHDFFRVDGHFELNQEALHIVCKIQARRKKDIACNGLSYARLIDHVGLLPVVMVAPDDVEMVTGSSEERRRLLDNTLSQLDTNYLGQLLLYNKLLEQRNAALKQFAETEQYDANLLAIYDQQLVAPAQAIFEARQQLVAQFIPVFNQSYQQISGQRETAAIQYNSNLSEKPMDQLLLDSNRKDRVLCRTSVGPHRDDISLMLDGHEVKKFGSQGQLKTFVLALRLAQFELMRQHKGFPPILLLDDIFDKLDKERVAQLLQLVTGEHYGQVFITDTQADRMASLMQQVKVESRLFQVTSGSVQAL